MGNKRQARGQPFVRLAAQLDHFVICKTGQNGWMFGHFKGAALGYFNGICQRLGQIGKESSHLSFGFKIMRWCQAAARSLLVKIGPFSDAN